MKNTYKEIQFGFGNLESAVKELEKHKQNCRLVFGVFNGVKLYSDVDDINSAYKKVTGMTKDEFDKERQNETERYNQTEKEYREIIPKLTKGFIEKGKQILDEKYHKNWNEMVPIRLNDLYHGLELVSCLDIVEKLNNGYTLKEAKEIINNQDHSGMSFSLVCSMVSAFCDRGPDFVEYIG